MDLNYMGVLVVVERNRSFLISQLLHFLYVENATAAYGWSTVSDGLRLQGPTAVTSRTEAPEWTDRECVSCREPVNGSCPWLHRGRLSD